MATRGRRRSTGRATSQSRWCATAVSGAVIAGATILGTQAVQRLAGESADESVARLDGQRLSIDVDLPGSGCDYGSAAGWDEVALDDLPRGPDAVEGTVRERREMGSFGIVRLHLTLPTTAAMSTIDVRRVEVVTTVTEVVPSWTIVQEGCGGSQYHRNYVSLLGRSSSELLVQEDAAEDFEDPEPGIFDPFSVTAGESVFLDYELNVCDPVTIDARFAVTYKPDSGDEQTVTVPEDPIRLTSLPAVAGYVSSEGELYPDGGEPPTPSAYCDQL